MFLLGDVANTSFFDSWFCGCFGCFFFEIKTFLFIRSWILSFCVVRIIVRDDGCYTFFLRTLNIKKLLFCLGLGSILVKYSLKLFLVVRIFFRWNFEFVFLSRLAALRLRLHIIYFQAMHIAWTIWTFCKSIYNFIKLNCMAW